MTSMRYKGYAAKIEYSDEDGCFIGHLAGIDDIVGFHGDSVVELRAAFYEAVDDYLDTCAQLNRVPQKPSFLAPEHQSGYLTLRIPPKIHAAMITKAQLVGKSVDQWAIDTFAHAVGF